MRQGATGGGSGTDWTNAYPNLPSALARGDTYWIADGSYGSYTFDDPLGGTSVITTRKATAASHGTNTGWNDTYGDGQATFGEMTFAHGYYVIDGARRNESNWADSSAYGIRISGSVYSSRLNSSSGQCADNLTLRYVDVGATVGGGASGANDTPAIYLGGFGQGSLACEDWTIHRSHVHSTKFTLVQCAGCDGLVVEYTSFSDGWGKEAIRGQIRADDMTVPILVVQELLPERSSRYHVRVYS